MHNRRTFFQLGQGYNMTRGGDGGYGAVFSEEHRRKLAASKMGNKHGVGAKRSPDHIAAIVLAHKGKVLTLEQRAFIRDRRTGKKASEQTRAKLSEALKGNKHGLTPASRAQLARVQVMNIGRPFTDEHRANLSKALRNSPKAKAHLARLHEIRFGEPQRLHKVAGA